MTELFHVLPNSLEPDDRLETALPEALKGRVLAPLVEAGMLCVEDLYECIANVGGNWYKAGVQGLDRDDAAVLVDWLRYNGQMIGEITARFYPSGKIPAELVPASSTTPEAALVPKTLDELELPSELSGEHGTNRTMQANALDAANDLQAIEMWLCARANNENTRAQYRKEAERFLLWCTMERGKALSSITARDAANYPRWLEALGRTEPGSWSRQWNVSQDRWIGPKNAPRLTARWRPFNGPLSAASRQSALTVIRLLFNFLMRTGYLRFNPFDQVSAKIHLLPGEGAPKAFADRSLTPKQWDCILNYLNGLPLTKANARLRVILSLGKGLGMRASEMVAAKAGWIVIRRIGDEDTRVIEIVGKGDKVRRLPVSDTMLESINTYFALRGEPDIDRCHPDVPLIANLGIGRQSSATRGISRSGLYHCLVTFFRAVAEVAQETSAADAAKLRAGTTHWLRHTFATTALKNMDINIVQNALGHASIGTTSRYLTPEEAQVAAALKKMDAL